MVGVGEVEGLGFHVFLHFVSRRSKTGELQQRAGSLAELLWTPEVLWALALGPWGGGVRLTTGLKGKLMEGFGSVIEICAFMACHQQARYSNCEDVTDCH